MPASSSLDINFKLFIGMQNVVLVTAFSLDPIHGAYVDNFPLSGFTIKEIHGLAAYSQQYSKMRGNKTRRLN
jgi:hypothetical protein